MKLNTTIKTLCAAVALAASAAASATLVTEANRDNFYLAPGALGTGDTTSDFNRADFAYDSTTSLTFTSATGGTFNTDFGWNGSDFVVPGSSTLGTNNILSFLPAGYLAGYGIGVYPSTNNWGITFSGTASGTFSVVNGEVILSYNTGNVDLFLLQGTWNGVVGAGAKETYTNLGNFMDISILGGQLGAGNTYLDGVVSFASASYGNLFNIAGSVPSCATGTGFAQILSCGDAAPIWSTFNFNTGDVLQVADVDGNEISGHHSGWVQFDVPEPGSLALLGAGLVGLGAIRRRKVAS